MSKFYVSNENGEWWVINPSTEAGQRLFIISEADLAKAVEEENPEDAGAELSTIDGLAGVIISNGYSVQVDLA